MKNNCIELLKEKVKENLSQSFQDPSEGKTGSNASSPFIVMTNEQLEQYCLRLVDGVITALVTVFGLTDEKEKLVSKREAMQQFGVCETTLYLWGKKGYLKPVKVGNRVMYRTDDINRISGSNI